MQNHGYPAGLDQRARPAAGEGPVQAGLDEGPEDRLLQAP